MDAEKILPLSPDTAAQIKSSTTVTSLNSVVIGLVENSLDAGSRKIEVLVDYGRGHCVVEDNGSGIVASEFEERGGLGRPYYTSKHGSKGRTHGNKGCFLSAVASLSLLTIKSQHTMNDSLSSLTLNHSKRITFQCTSSTDDPLSSKTHGTRVSVQNLFGNMPVRVKQRSSHVDRCERINEKEAVGLSNALIALLLSWHCQVSLSVSLADSKKRLLCIRSKPDSQYLETSRPGNSSSNFKESVLATRLDQAWVCSILSQSGLIEANQIRSWTKVSARTPSIAAKGVISMLPAPSRRLQFISLGVKPLPPQGIGSMLYDEVNKMFSASSFGHTETPEQASQLTTASRQRVKQGDLTRRELKGTAKGIDRWPMFYITIELENGNRGHELEREGPLRVIIEVLRALITGFLNENHLRPQARTARRKRSSMASLARSRSASIETSAFSSWSRIKSSKAYPTTRKLAPRPIDNDPEEPKNPSSDSKSMSNEIGDSPRGGVDLPHRLKEERTIEWLDPATNAIVKINSRTGLATSYTKGYSRPRTSPAVMQMGSWFTKGSQHGLSSGQCNSNSWANELLASWKNPIFAPTEVAIPRLSNETNMELADVLVTIRSSASGALPTDKQATTSRPYVTARVSKGEFACARVIRQVDGKFILASAPAAHSLKLILIDQHAADERIRVEALLKDLHSLPAVQLDRSLEFSIASKEAAMLTSLESYFCCFNITYTVDDSIISAALSTDSSPTAQCQQVRLRVTTLPSAIAERCRLQPVLLLDLLRSVIWSEHKPSIPPPADSNIRPPPPPPKELLEMINSRACRSAIMFNDVLNQAEAEVLARKLARMEMPFQCAHGRTSMVPLVEIGGQGECLGSGFMGNGLDSALDVGLGDSSNDKTKGVWEQDERFVDAWKRWQSRDLEDSSDLE